jgi:hypothetical protein
MRETSRRHWGITPSIDGRAEGSGGGPRDSLPGLLRFSSCARISFSGFPGGGGLTLVVSGDGGRLVSVQVIVFAYKLVIVQNVKFFTG